MTTELNTLEPEVAPCAMAALTIKDYKSDYKPVWCPGCGDYAVLQAITKAMVETGRRPEEIAVISGIGCSSRIPAYTNSYGFHGVHGRALCLATGVKIARPDLLVVAAGGDGDGFSIGGNHFMHACRRNVDITYIVMDNRVYGMTKGQASPTTEPDWDHSALTPDGPGVAAFQPLMIALASGANFIARAFSGDTNQTAKIILEGIKHPGFSLIQVMSPCVTYRPEQRDWKKDMHDGVAEPTSDAVEAARILAADDGLNVGIFFKGSRVPYQPSLEPKIKHISELEQQFVM